MTRNLLALTLVLLSLPVFSQVNFSASTHCTYQKGQFLSKTEAENVTNSKPLNWTFNGLSGSKPLYLSGGDTGEVISVPLESGIIIYLPYPTGTHTFTVWNSGQSFWAKQSSLAGNINAQQYIGSCAN